MHYAVVAHGANDRLEEARAAGAEELAPYEYYYAKEHAQQAEVEASEANYSDAVALAQRAERAASKAIELARSARRTAP